MATSEAPRDDRSAIEQAVEEQLELISDDVDVERLYEEEIAGDERFKMLANYLTEEFGWELDSGRMAGAEFQNELYQVIEMTPTVVELGLHTGDDDTTAQITVELINGRVHRIVGSAIQFDHEAVPDEGGDGPRHRYREFVVLDGEVFVHQSDDDDDSVRRDALRYRLLDRLRRPHKDTDPDEPGEPPSLLEELYRVRNELDSLPEEHRQAIMTPELTDAMDRLISKLETDPSIEHRIRDQQPSLNTLSSEQKWCGFCRTAVQLLEDTLEFVGPWAIMLLIMYASGGLAIPSGLGIAGLFLFASTQGSRPGFDIYAFLERVIGRGISWILGSEETRLKRRYWLCRKFHLCSESGTADNGEVG